MTKPTIYIYPSKGYDAISKEVVPSLVVDVFLNGILMRTRHFNAEPENENFIKGKLIITEDEAVQRGIEILKDQGYKSYRIRKYRSADSYLFWTRKKFQ